MIVEISGACQYCAVQVKILMMDGRSLDCCSSCGEQAFIFRQLKGVIYIVDNPNQSGVKVGLTTKHIDDRIKQLNTTGVAGSFRKIAIFPSDRLKSDEKKVHEKISRYRLEKEHFELDPIQAVLKAHRALNYRKPIFFDEKDKEKFDLLNDMEKIKMKLMIKK